MAAGPWARRWAIVGVMAAAVVGCTSPPATTALMLVAQKAIEGETVMQQEDLARDRQALAERREALRTAFEADLAGRSELDAGWVRDAAEGYAAAVEGLVRHEAELERMRRQRVENLRAACEAQERAMTLLTGQDAVIRGMMGWDAWDEMYKLSGKEGR
ncbi:MAG: hypothetical protein IT441_07335 [Phycisphaeraceae bacterium]|nr:hypothetical protein [Phycisphaeraceae bacterium]